MNLFELFATITLDTSEYEKNVNSAEKKFEGLGESAEGAGEKTKQSGEKVKQFGKGAEDAGGGVDSLADKMQKAVISGNLMASALEKGFEILSSVASWVYNLDEATEDYRASQAKLNTAFESQGLSLSTANQAYSDFYKILGDSDTAVEASQLLATLAENQQDVEKWTKISAGVYGTFGDALPINSLIEASNETAKVGTVTGVLADALNWAGINEDKFNGLLAECSTEAERNQLIMETLAGTYDSAAETFEKNNEQLMLHRENELALQEMTAQLGEEMGEFKDNILADLIPHFQNAADKGVDFLERVGKAFSDSGVVESFGAVLDSAIMLLDPLASLIEIFLPALATVLKPVASLLALIADVADAVIAVFSLNFEKFNTAMGQNVEHGMLSHQQQLYYADALETSVYDPTIGAWVGNGAGTTNNVTNYNVNVDASGINELQTIAREAQNQRVSTRMGVS